MISATHTLIGETILSLIQNEVDLLIDGDQFKKGCVKPDYSLEFFFVPHYKDESFEFIMNMVEELCNFKGTGENSYKIFSSKLGVIIHFLSDYFCTAHNDSKYNNLVKHYQYERKLHREFLKTSIGDICLIKFDSVKNIIYSSPDLIKKYINEKHKIYLNSEHTMENDVIFTVNVCTTVIYSIIKCYQHNKALKVA